MSVDRHDSFAGRLLQLRISQLHSYHPNFNNLSPIGDTMPKAYWISTYHAIHDEAAVAAYAALAGPALAAGGATFLALGMPQLVKEAGKSMRTVLAEFPSVAAAQAAYESPGYQLALAALGQNGAVRDIRIIEGV
jgi:uncharacterized protein (DUF1330 family)